MLNLFPFQHVRITLFFYLLWVEVHHAMYTNRPRNTTPGCKHWSILPLLWNKEKRLKTIEKKFLNNLQVWHSKADKIVNNLYGTNPVPISYCQNSFLLSKLIFNVQTYKFSWSLGHKISWSISIPFQRQNFMLSPIPFQFYAQLCSIPKANYVQPPFHSKGKISLSNPFHSNDKISWSASFHSNGVSDLFQSSNPIGQYTWLYAFMRRCPRGGRTWRHI